MSTQLLAIKTRFTDDTGAPLKGGQVYTFYAGTSTPKETYKDVDLLIPNTNPVILDDTGAADIYLKGSYRIRVLDRFGALIEEQDDVSKIISRVDAGELVGSLVSAITNLSDTKSEIEKVKLDTGITATAKFGGAINRTQSDINEQSLWGADFGIVPNSTDDQTDKFVKFFAAIRDSRLVGNLEAGEFRIRPDVLDIGGIKLRGTKGGYKNTVGGTVLVSTEKTGTLLGHSTLSGVGTYINLENIAIKNAGLAIHMNYVLYSKLDTIFIYDSIDGVKIGDETTAAGTLKTQLNQVHVVVDGKPLQIVGESWNNTNVINACFFKGKEYSNIDVGGGHGAIATTIFATEFAGKYGLRLGNTRATLIINPYFECENNSLLLDGFSAATTIIGGVWGSLTNEDVASTSSHIMYKSGVCTLSIQGGWVTTGSSEKYTNLNFLNCDSSSTPSKLSVNFVEKPYTAGLASGFKLVGANATTAKISGAITLSQPIDFVPDFGSLNMGNSVIDYTSNRIGANVTVRLSAYLDGYSIGDEGDLYFRILVRARDAYYAGSGYLEVMKEEVKTFKPITAVVRNGFITVYILDSDGSYRKLRTGDFTGAETGTVLSFTVNYKAA